uniref:PIN domain-containing protein n=1 Tax=Candidatus Kentrum sp. LFY TaxID=2126342 RepID=A0A450UTC9_9GAMM|nr:MAG: hypothetical protein BECKLFY1418B_GA0070995_106417 [Candidatus Kentron sp. LFY]VFJ95789.1 MAG: hypothetical protein BECKLFY1418A_GA0070994_10536 [Candidatus Kentron sp. LFY]
MSRSIERLSLHRRRRIFALAEHFGIEGFLCATTVTTIDYLLGRCIPVSDARKAIGKLLQLFEIAPVNRPVLEQTLLSRISDFEDAVLEQSGLLVGADVIVTRNTRDFMNASIPALEPDKLLSMINKDLENGTEPKERNP